jgi:hypothetical protein
VFTGASCDSTTDPLASSAPSDAPTAAATLDSAAISDSLHPAFASAGYSGLPFGPFGLWKSATDVYWGPAPFTGSHNYTDASNIVTQINSARNKRQRLVLAMTGGYTNRYLSNGRFDFTKWKNKMNTFKTTAIKNAVAAGVSDGTIIGNTVMDEPETRQWGGVMTKPLLDQMASYVKSMFPTLPVGVNHGPTGYYQWRTTEHYRVMDYVLNQYAHWVTSGNVGAWRDKVLAQASKDGVTPAFSLNILNGGAQDRQGSYDCSGTGGKGTYFPNCRMTPEQVSSWGRTLGVAGCVLTMWRYDGAFLSKSANVSAMRDVASMMASRSRRSCHR